MKQSRSKLAAALLVVRVVGLEGEYQAVQGQFEDPPGVMDDVGLLHA
jgi:hypothetical protein